MDFPKSDVVSLIYHLLPGFVTAWIFYGLTPHQPKSPFERTIQALIFTAITQAVVIPLGWLLLWIGSHVRVLGPWNEQSSFAVSVLVAAGLGLLFTGIANTNWLHGWISRWITTRTSFPSEWYSAFRAMKRYVYLHLSDGRRLYGWPTEWPDQPTVGHFVLLEPEWILDDNTRAPLVLIDQMLIPVSAVAMIEFEKPAGDLAKIDLNKHNQAEETLINLNVKVPKEPQEQNSDGKPETAARVD
jgi:hypothetical protein